MHVNIDIHFPTSLSLSKRKFESSKAALKLNESLPLKHFYSKCLGKKFNESYPKFLNVVYVEYFEWEEV